MQVDLLEVTVVCKEILAKSNLEKLTTRQLREEIAREIGASSDDLESEQVKEHIDKVFLEFMLAIEADKADKENSSIEGVDMKNDPSEKANKANKSATKATSQTKTSSKKESSIDRLKSYINKCGVRKIWKRELEGMNENESIRRLQDILRNEIGMQGRPTLDKCREIKRKREFEAEMREIDTDNVVEGRLRSRRAKITTKDIENNKGDDSEEDQDGSESTILTTSEQGKEAGSDTSDTSSSSTGSEDEEVFREYESEQESEGADQSQDSEGDTSASEEKYTSD